MGKGGAGAFFSARVLCVIHGGVVWYEGGGGGCFSFVHERFVRDVGAGGRGAADGGAGVR